MDGKSNPPQLEALSYPWNVPVIVIYSLTAFVSLCSNLITVVILLKGEHLSTELWKFLLNLCIADIIMSIFCTEVSVCASVWPSFSHFSSLLCVISSFNQRLSILTGFYLPFSLFPLARHLTWQFTYTSYMLGRWIFPQWSCALISCIQCTSVTVS